MSAQCYKLSISCRRHNRLKVMNDNKSRPTAEQESRRQTGSGRVSGAVMYLCLFLLSWPLIVWGTWDIAHQYAASTLMPWLMELINHSSDLATYALGSGIAIAGGFVAAIVVFVLLLLVSIAWYRVKRLFVR